MALWIIAVLSIMVLSFAAEAHFQAGINTYVRERNRVNRLVDAGQILAEVVISGYASASDRSEDEDAEKLFEDDRWYKEKRALKVGQPCVIGPILVDEENPDSGTVRVEICLARGINLNELTPEGDTNWRVRWEMLLTKVCGIPEDHEVEAYDAQHHGRSHYKLVDLLIASFADWVDADDNAMDIDGKDCGAEARWYEEEYDDRKVDDEDKRYPRNGPIPDVRELSYIRGFREFPAVLTGGVLNPEDDEKNQITVRGIASLFNTIGTAKIYVNDCTREELLTVPGICSEDDDDDEKSQELISAILGAKEELPDYDVDESQSWWEYKDFADLQQRVSDYASGLDISSEASSYLVFKPDETTIFEITIDCESMGMTRTVCAKAYLKDGNVRYVEWDEAPTGDRKEGAKNEVN